MSDKIDLLVTGYIKINANYYVPSEIYQVIMSFYMMYFLVSIYDENGCNIISDTQNIYCNGDSLYMIKHDGSLYVRGSNKFGQLGIDTKWENVQTPTLNEFFVKNNNIALISQGITNECCFILSKNNILYGFGWNRYNQLGIKTTESKNYSPLIIKYDFKSVLKSIQCGFRHSVFLTENGNVYGCGNNSYNQLSTKYINSNYGDSVIQNIIDTQNVIHINCCLYSSYILYNNNIGMSVGHNTSGELGINNHHIKNSVIFREILDGNKIQKLDAGYLHIGCLTQMNELYMFGFNRRGQCNTPFHTGKVHKGNKVKLSNNDTIIDVKCGYDHTIIKTYDHDKDLTHFYGFGSNYKGQLLIPQNRITFYLPKSISIEYIQKLTKSNKKIIDIMPSWEETFLIQEN